VAFLSDAHLNCPRVMEWIQTLRHASRFYTIRNARLALEAEGIHLADAGTARRTRAAQGRRTLWLWRAFLDFVASGKTAKVEGPR
jgi:hypothetical protein